MNLNHMHTEKLLDELQRLRSQGHHTHICAALIVFACGFVLGKKCGRRMLSHRYRSSETDQAAAKPNEVQRWESEGGRSMATARSNIDE